MARQEGRVCAQIFLFFFRRPITSLFYLEFHCLNTSLMILELRFDMFQLLYFMLCFVGVLFFFPLMCGLCSTFSSVLAFYWRQNQWQIDMLSCRDVAGDTFVSVVVICSHHYSSRAAQSGTASIRIERLILALPRRVAFRKTLFSPCTQEKKSKIKILDLKSHEG
jgi:hypothetical protein